MEITEKVAYLKGLMEGMKIDTESNEGKILTAMADILEDIGLELEDLWNAQGELEDGLDVVSDDLEDVEDIVYDVADYPLWVDTAVVKLREIARLDALTKTLRRQVELLEKELRSTAQRVNLFEKVKIPETRENIRVIGIYLGDQQTSAVVRGKIAKKKLQEASR